MLIQPKSLRLLAILVMLAAVCICGAGEFELTIMRKYQDENCTSGYLALNGEIICYTVERPWLDNQKNLSSIPTGRYKARLRYDKSDHWRIQLEGVPDGPVFRFILGTNRQKARDVFWSVRS